MEASDGWIMPSYAGLGTWWEGFAAFMEQPELAAEHMLTPDGRQRHAAEIDALAGPLLKMQTKQQIFHGGQEAGLTLTALQDAGEVVDSPQLMERDFSIEQVHPVAGTVRMPGMVPFASNTPRGTVSPAPLLRQHNAEVLSALGLTSDDIAALTGAGII
jgi:CoA:oxalate CoA-transferase